MVARSALVRLADGSLSELPTGDTLNGASGGGVVAPVCGRVRRSTNQSIPAGAGYTLLIFDTAALQKNGTFFASGLPTEIILSIDGVAEIQFEATGESAATAVLWEVEIRIAGALIGAGSFMALASSSAPLKENALRDCLANQKLTVGVRHNNATALNILTEGDHSPDVWISYQLGAKGDSGPIGTTLALTFGMVSN
jgi:hypothetical protein